MDDLAHAARLGAGRTRLIDVAEEVGIRIPEDVHERGTFHGHQGRFRARPPCG